MTGAGIRLGGTHALQYAAETDPSKIARLNRNQASYRPKCHRETRYDSHRNALNQHERHQHQKRSYGENGSLNQPYEKVQCDHGYQDIPPQVQNLVVGGRRY